MMIGTYSRERLSLTHLTNGAHYEIAGARYGAAYYSPDWFHN